MSIPPPKPPHRSAPPNEPLDRTRLADVLRGNERSPPAFVAEFRRSIDADVQHLLDACGSDDPERAKQAAHRIEGASKIIGAQPMGQACRLVARAAWFGEAETLRAAIDAFLERKAQLYACLNQLHPEAAGARPGSAGNEVCAGLVFLVVEDHEFQRGIIIRLLRQLGASEVHGFADGASALAAARELRSRAIMVLDLAMPGLSGMDVIQVAGQERLLVSFIINSALDDDLLRWPLQAARSCGATVLGGVSKPLTAAKLAPLVAQHRTDPRAGSPVLSTGSNAVERAMAEPERGSPGRAAPDPGPSSS